MFDASVDDPLCLLGLENHGSLLLRFDCYAVLKLAQMFAMLLVEASKLHQEPAPTSLVGLQGVSRLELEGILWVDVLDISLDHGC